MSLRSGTWEITQGSLVSSVAARMGSAEFFEPLMRTDPLSLVAPVNDNLIHSNCSVRS